MIVNAILVLGMIGMSLNNGAYLGEKGCTLAVSLEKQQSEGRKIDESLKTQVFDRKIAAWILIFGMLPFLLISTLNAVSQPFYQTGEAVQQSAQVEKEAFSFDYGTGEEEEAAVQGTVNPFNLVARMTFMPYVTVYSLVNNSALNALFFLFSLPLPAAAAIGYLAGKGRETPAYCLELLLIWLGNLAGCWLTAFAVWKTRIWVSLLERVTGICLVKCNDSFISLLILGIFCGMLMYLAVDTFRSDTVKPIVKVANLFLCVAVFILSGFEHCIADMYYFSLAQMWSGHTFLAILVITAGNTIGGMALHYWKNYSKTA
jgi:hypothetical protein